MNVRVHVFVTGQVQGVFFRSETRRRARLLNVTGWIKNLGDGRVEAVFEGNRENVDALIAFCRQGPSSARVTDIQVLFERYAGAYKGFQIIW